MKIFRLVLVAALVAAAVPSQTLAQSANAMRASGAPVASRMTVGVRKSLNAPAPVPAPRIPRADTRQNRAMMIVGGAAMLTGAVVGGDAGTLISVGGAVVFLWGLYQFLQ
jgi:hypothetical protein